ncbi:MAG: LuxR C-terminal-related transcriptional regulator [Candidatus Omnitrophota bacterium]|nr:LuxR C-terminal-related transcriptional regulator [Candidatus Omnitrophota bacterium]
MVNNISPERWSLLWSNIPGFILEADLEGTIVVISRVLPNLEIDKVVGTSVFDYVPPDQLPILRKAMEEALRTHKTQAYEISTLIEGRVNWFSSRVVPIEKDKKVESFLIIANEITDQKIAQQEYLAQFQRIQKRLDAIVRLATNEAVIHGNFEEAAKVITRTAAHVFNVERVSIWLLSPDQDKLTCLTLHEKSQDKNSQGLILYAKDYPNYFKALSTGRAVDAHEAMTDPRTLEFAVGYLRPLGITSMLDAAIRISGKIVGVVCHEHIGSPRRWQADEMAFAGEIADQVAHVILNSERKKALEDLERAHIYLENRVKERTSELVRENTERKKAEEALQSSQEELLKQKKALEQKNMALKEVLEQIEIEKKQIKDDIRANVEELLLPALKRLKRKGSPFDRKYLDLLEQNMHHIVSAFGGKISEKQWKLTPREIEICNMIKNGLTSKEISDLLNISTRTIEIHRNNIRRKLNITHKGINLASFLQSI